MNPDEQQFEALRKLMALKRHEQPPHRYLNELPGRILTRIERGEGQLNLWERLSASFALRPALAYAFGLTACGAIGLSGIYLASQDMARTSPGESPAVALGVPAPAAALASQSRESEEVPLHVANWLRNTNPAADSQPELSLFTSTHYAVPVSYELAH